MKRFWQVVMVLCVMVGISGCGGSGKNQDPKNIETLRIMFVPSKNPDAIEQTTAPLAANVKASLEKQGFVVDNVEVSVGDNYEVVGEALASGSVDVGFIPAGTYVKYQKDGVEVLLSATRKGLSIDSMDPKVWNENKPTELTDAQVDNYSSLIIAGPSAKGKDLATKVNKGEKLTWDELNSAKWCTSSPTSSSGYLYPSLWLDENYGKKLSDIKNQSRVASYGDSMNSLATGVCDISLGFSDLRIEFADSWSGNGSIWDDTNVIGVSGPIMNDTISVSTKSPNMSDVLKNALITTFTELPNTNEGQQIMSIYNHTGYVVPKLEDYNKEREVLKQIEE